jgi:thiol-disulfide isomerase/thioredoxin
MHNEHTLTRRLFLKGASVAIAGVPIRRRHPLLAATTHAPHASVPDSPLDSLTRANGWLNSRALTTPELHGKVVLVQFWTFTCINWLRTLPYVRAWSEKYRDAGLVVIGAHTPEFQFERNIDNVRRLAGDLNVRYPVAIDSDFAIWNGFKNQYWPALYLLDGDGRVQYHVFGEGGYIETERNIQRMLGEAGARTVDRSLVAVQGHGLEAAAAWNDLRTPETYVGYARADHFTSSGNVVRDHAHVYELPSTLAANKWALGGDWTVANSGATANTHAARIQFRFHARDLHLVMGPPRGHAPAKFRVTVDGNAPGSSHGADVDAQGNGIAKDQRVYQLIRQSQPVVDRTFQIEFSDPGVQAFSFTFG